VSYSFFEWFSISTPQVIPQIALAGKYFNVTKS